MGIGRRDEFATDCAHRHLVWGCRDFPPASVSCRRSDEFALWCKYSAVGYVASTRKLRIGFIGRIHPTKGIESAIESVLGVSQDRCELLIAGSGRHGYELSLRQRFNQDNVRFLGWSDPSEFFESIDLLLVPSAWHEPLPRTIVEAASYGVPVLASTRGGIPEVVDERENGWLYDPDEEGALSRKLNQLVAEPHRIYELRESCKRKARDFSHKRMASSYIEVYQSAMRHVDSNIPDGSANL